MKLQKTHVELMLHKPSEIQWNVTGTGTLPGKTERKIYSALSYKILPPWNHKNVRNGYFFWGGVLWGPGNVYAYQWFFMILWISESFSLLVKNSLNFLKLGFFTYFEYILEGILRKSILRSDYHSARWYWCKKDQKNLPQTSHNLPQTSSRFQLLTLQGALILS